MDQNPTKKQQFTKLKELFVQKFAEQPLDDIKFIKTTTTDFNELSLASKQQLSTMGVITDKEKMKEIITKLNEFKEENKDAKLFEDLSFKQTIQKGDKFQSIKDLKCVFEDKTETLEHKDGIVYLIDFWATWCGPCQRPMQHNQDMLEKNGEKWKDKVEIYGVSLDDSIDDIKKRVETKKWHSIHHYQTPSLFILNSFFKKGEENIGNFEVDGIPTIYIINQQGMIVYNGHPMSINVEEFINKLLENANTEKKQEKIKVEKEKFKQMKNKVEQYLKWALEKEDKFKLNISFQKKKIFDSKWNVLEKKYHKPTLSYSVKIKHNQKLQKILQQLFEKFPKTEFKIKKEQIIDKKLAQENCIKFATSQLKEQGLTAIPTLNLLVQTKLKFQNRRINEGIIQKNNKLVFGSDKPYPPSQSQKVQKFNEELQSYKSKAKFKDDVEILNTLNAQSKIAIGDPFFSVKGYKITIPPLPEEKKEEKTEEKLEEKPEKQEQEEKKEEEVKKEEEKKEKEIVTIEHKPGEVLLVDFWATWCPPCQAPMQHNQEMLEKHKEDWGNKVRIVAASLDQEEQTVIKRAQEKKWLDIEYIILNNEEFQESPRIYGVRGIPFIVIVNKQGKIKHLGHPSSIKVEEFLQKLVDEKEEGEEEKKEEEKKEKGVINEEQFNQLAAIQKQYLPLIREKIKDEKFKPTIVFKIAKKVNYDLEGKIVGQPQCIAKKLFIKMYETSYNKISEIAGLIDKIEKIIKLTDFEQEFKKELDKTVDLQFGTECNSCKKPLASQDKQYYCHFHKEWYCYDCGNKIDEEKKGNSKYLHPCNMVYINVINDSGMKDIDEYKFGENIQYDENDQQHSYCCNGCSGGGVERFICLTCRPGPMRPGGFVDICEHCMKILGERNLESEEYKNVKKGVMDENHDEQTHVLLRILFGKGNYYKY